MASDKKDAKNKRRAKRLAERAQRFERHAALVNERDGDPAYAHRRTNADGSVTVSIPSSANPQIQGELAAAGDRFREKFGREAGPSDPVFFDSDADTPSPISEEKITAELRAAAETMPDPQTRAYMLAYADCGYLVTEANRHTFTAHEVEEFLDAVERHLPDDEDDPL